MALAEIDRNIARNQSWTGTPDEVNEPKPDIPALEDLRMLVLGAYVGEEWLTDTQNMRINEELFRAGKLARARSGHYSTLNDFLPLSRRCDPHHSATVPVDGACKTSSARRIFSSSVVASCSRHKTLHRVTFPK